jgi:hypothetical protein
VEKLKDFWSGYACFGLIAGVAIFTITLIIDYTLPEWLPTVIFSISWISVTLICWIIDDRIEKTRVKKRMTGIETNTPNQVLDRIKKALKIEKPSIAEILSYLYILQATNSLSNFEFFDIIGQTFRMSPKFFMLSIYPNIRSKFRKIYGDEGMQVMNKNILEKFCLDEGEQIIYELNGTIGKKVPKKYTIKVLHGTIYVTNYRIVVHGKLVFELEVDTGGSFKNPKEAKIAYISNSTPCYGYSFPIKNLHGLINPSAFNNYNLSYSVKQDENLYSDDCRITIDASKKEEHGDKLFAILDKFQI